MFLTWIYKDSSKSADLNQCHVIRRRPEHFCNTARNTGYSIYFRLCQSGYL